MAKVCPFKFTASKLDKTCEQKNCGWWCAWSESCAIVAIAGDINDKSHDIINAIKGKV